MSHDELMSLARRHNKSLGLSRDVLEPVLGGVAATFRPPAVQPFTVGVANRKDEYRSAWKSLAKRVSAPLFALPTAHEPPAAGATTAPPTAPAGPAPASGPAPAHATGPTPSARPAAASLPEKLMPTHAQMYGTERPSDPAHTQFLDTLTAWLGAGPIDLPLLAPGAPTLSLRRLFMEVGPRCRGQAGRTPVAYTACHVSQGHARHADTPNLRLCLPTTAQRFARSCRPCVLCFHTSTRSRATTASCVSLLAGR